MSVSPLSSPALPGTPLPIRVTLGLASSIASGAPHSGVQTAPASTPIRDVREYPVGAPLPLGTPVAQGKAGWKLWDEKTTTQAIVNAIDGAQHTVDVEFFGFLDAGKGKHVVAALERAGRRGVQVNVIADASSIFALPPMGYWNMKRKVEATGGTVITNFRLPLVRDHDDTPGLKHVDHRKVVSVDGGRTAFVGGINYFPIEDDFHDSMVQLTGPAAARLGANQLERWRRAGGPVTPRHAGALGQAIEGHALALAAPSPHDMHVIQNAPETNDYTLTNRYIELIRSAKHRLWISSPAFTDQKLVHEINEAAARGVDVRIIAPGKPPLGIPAINWVGQSHLRELVGLGAKVVEIPGVLHRKALIADDEVVFSTFNITNRSRTHDHEVGIDTKDPEFVAAIEKVLDTDFRTGTPLAAKRGGFGEFFGDLVSQRLKITY